MNPEYQTLYFFGVIAASATFARVTAQSKTKLVDWIALGNLGLLLAQLIILAARPSL